MSASTAADRAGFRARSRSRRTRAVAITAVLIATIATLVSSSVSGPANADITIPPGSALSQAAEVDSGTLSASPSVVILGAINGTALLSSVTSLLVAPLLALPNTLTADLAGSLVGSGLQANSPSTTQTRPASGFPNCSQGGWTSADCYGPVTPAVAAPALVTLNSGTVQGYATQDGAGYVAAAQAANPVLSMFGVTLGNLGVSNSNAQCGNSSGCTATHSLTGGSLFSGKLTYSIASGTILASVGATNLTTTPLTVVSGVTATLSGNLLTVKVALTVTQLLAALGTTLSALGGQLGDTLTDSGSTITMVVTIGPGNIASTGSSTSSAWGLDVALDLTGALKLNVTAIGGLVNLATIVVNLARSDPSAPDLYDMKLAYSAAATNFIPPALI